jgi:ABC-2 type transport system permease protein
MSLINLIRNEFAKIFHKKSLWIVAILLVVISITMNVMIKQTSQNQYQNQYTYSEGYVNYVKEDLAKLDPKKPSDNALYIDTKTNLDMVELMNQFEEDSWQRQVIEKSVSPVIREKNQFEFSLEKNETALKEKQVEYQQICQKLEEGDWKYFAEQELKNIDEQMAQMTQIDQAQEEMPKQQVQENKLQKEQLEIQKQAATWRLEKDIPYGNSYLSRAIDLYVNYSSVVQNLEQNKETQEYQDKLQYQKALEKANLYQYDIEHNTNTQEENTAHGMLMGVFGNYEVMILVVLIMIAGVMISEEFNKGTIKLLLVKPYKRTSILAAKWITCIAMIFITILFVIGVQFIVGGLTFGFESMDLPVVKYDFASDQITTMGITSFIGLTTLCRLPIYVLLVTLSFALSTLTNNSPLAIALPLLGYMGSSMINALAEMYKWDWIRYFVTPNWDLTQFLFGRLPSMAGLTIGFSIIVCLVYLIIMLVPSFVVFKKKNIKNI